MKRLQHFLKIRGAAAQASPLSLNIHGKEVKKDQELGERCVPGYDDGSTEMKGKKKKKMNCREGRWELLFISVSAKSRITFPVFSQEIQ